MRWMPPRNHLDDGTIGRDTRNSLVRVSELIDLCVCACEAEVGRTTAENSMKGKISLQFGPR